MYFDAGLKCVVHYVAHTATSTSSPTRSITISCLPGWNPYVAKSAILRRKTKCPSYTVHLKVLAMVGGRIDNVMRSIYGNGTNRDPCIHIWHSCMSWINQFQSHEGASTRVPNLYTCHRHWAMARWRSGAKNPRAITSTPKGFHASSFCRYHLRIKLLDCSGST